MLSTPLLDLSLLQTLVAIQHAGTLARAADKVGHTQSALSLQTQRPEQTLVSNSSIATPRARVHRCRGGDLQYANRLLDLNREAVNSVRGRRVAGLVRVGISVDFEHTWLPKAMARFSKSHPKIVPELRVDRNSSFEQAVGRKEPDIALISGRVTRWRSREMRPLPLS